MGFTSRAEMATTQASLNQFFKAKKSARDVHSLKNGKPIVKEVVNPVKIENKCENVKEKLENTIAESDAKVDIVAKVETVVFAKPEVKPRRTVASAKSRSRSSSGKRGDKANNSGEDILEALKRAAAKQGYILKKAQSE